MVVRLFICSPGDEADWAEKTGRDGRDQVEVLHLEAPAILGHQRGVVARRQGRPGLIAVL